MAKFGFAVDNTTYCSNLQQCYFFVVAIDNTNDRQFSLARPDQAPLPQGSHGNSVYDRDLEAFLNPGGDNIVHRIPLPTDRYQSQSEFDDAVRRSGESYRQGEYSIWGPNSNTAADNIIENAGGVVPDVHGAVAQNHGE